MNKPASNLALSCNTIWVLFIHAQASFPLLNDCETLLSLKELVSN